MTLSLGQGMQCVDSPKLTCVSYQPGLFIIYLEIIYHKFRNNTVEVLESLDSAAP